MADRTVPHVREASAGGGLAPRRQPSIRCSKCGEPDKRRDCDGNGWLEAIGPCRDGSYITSRPCPYDNRYFE